MTKHLRAIVALVGTLATAAACDVDTAPVGLRQTPPGDGPTVKFEITHRPLPEIPFPNDIATFADPTSRTGRRLNASLVAPTAFERIAREGFDAMEGFGTSSPVAVAFERAAGADPREPAIDLEDVARRMQEGELDLSNDPVYLVNLTTGVPMFVDAGNGFYPVVLRDPWRYMPNDPKAGESNLAFETVEEGAGLPQSAYRPELDTDFDGVLDHPNVLARPGTSARGIPGVDDRLTWYERETDTLILRPVLPLEEKTEYAVVLTDRLRSPGGKPVRSPFDAIHHPSQRRGIARLADVGGARGTLVAALLDANAELEGVLLDLPHVVASAKTALARLGTRCEVVAGDFFTSVPEGDLLLLQNVLHDWDDGQCATILKNCAAALRPGGRVVIVEQIIPDEGRPSHATLMDLNMLVMLRGHERTLREHDVLLQAAGLRVHRVMQTRSPFSLLEATRI